MYGKVRYYSKEWQLNQTRTMIVLTNKKINDTYKTTLEAMRARFIEITDACFDEVLDDDACISNSMYKETTTNYNYCNGQIVID